MARTHGTEGSYSYGGCRCRVCTDAHRQYNQARRASYIARLGADPTIATHGQRSTYVNYGCRCEPCRAANTAACAEYARRRRERQEASRA